MIGAEVEGSEGIVNLVRVDDVDLVWRPLRDDAAAGQVDKPVSTMLNGARVGDQDPRATGELATDGVLEDEGAGGRVEGGERVAAVSDCSYGCDALEDDDGCLRVACPSERDAMTLAARQRQAALAEALARPTKSSTYPISVRSPAGMAARSGRSAHASSTRE